MSQISSGFLEAIKIKAQGKSSTSLQILFGTNIDFGFTPEFLFETLLLLTHNTHKVKKKHVVN